MKNDLRWLIPGELAGMPMPYLDQQRRAPGGGAIDAFDDELRLLQESGVNAVVSLLNIPGDARIYQGAGLDFLLLPIPDGGAPSLDQAEQVVRFIDLERSPKRAVAVHCAAGLGRTGTILAAYLIANGMTAAAAVAKVRAIEPAAIETNRQLQFLRDFETHVRHS